MTREPCADSLPAAARIVIREIADDLRRPPRGTLGDLIALRRWIAYVARRLDRVVDMWPTAHRAATSIEREARRSGTALRS